MKILIGNEDMKRILLLVNMTLGLGTLVNHAAANITHDEKPGYYSDNRTDLEFNENTLESW